MYKMNNCNEVMQLELMAVSSLCAEKRKKIPNNTLEKGSKVPSFQSSTSFSLVPVILSLSTFCGGKWVPWPAMSLAFFLAVSLTL